MPQTAATGMDAFRKVFAEFRSTMLLAIGASALMPLVAAFAALDPPWPDGIEIITSVMTLLILIFVFQFLWKRARKTVNRTMVAGAVLVALGGVTYFTMRDMFVYEIPTTHEQAIAGCGWTSNAAVVAADFLADPADGCPGNYKKMLESAEYDARQIWRPNSITQIKMALLVSWLALFSGVSLIVAAFVTYQIRRKE